jgi:hypothetical protein
VFGSGVRRIKRFWGWLPILWKDEDWDYVYLFEIMRYKISRIRKDIERVDRHTDCQETIKTMKEVEELLTRQSFSNYYYEWFEKVNGNCQCVEENQEITSNGVWKNPFCENCLELLKAKNELENEEFAKLWEMIREHSRSWWD